MYYILSSCFFLLSSISWLNINVSTACVILSLIRFHTYFATQISCVLHVSSVEVPAH